jgi:hypothetical protein
LAPPVMTYRKYSEEDLRAYLLNHAEIRAFYVSTGLIHFIDTNGQAWCLMEDDDDLVSDALQFLKIQGAPFLDEIGAAQEFERNWGK